VHDLVAQRPARHIFRLFDDADRPTTPAQSARRREQQRQKVLGTFAQARIVHHSAAFLPCLASFSPPPK
jgi:hypothetical protein